MLRTLKLLLAVLALAGFLGGCVVLKPKGLPPGQVKKATGVNPASGKAKHR